MDAPVASATPVALVSRHPGRSLQRSNSVSKTQIELHDLPDNVLDIQSALSCSTLIVDKFMLTAVR